MIGGPGEVRDERELIDEGDGDATSRSRGLAAAQRVERVDPNALNGSVGVCRSPEPNNALRSMRSAMSGSAIGADRVEDLGYLEPSRLTAAATLRGDSDRSFCYGNLG
jgi:hypothetical protein